MSTSIVSHKNLLLSFLSLSLAFGLVAFLPESVKSTVPTRKSDPDVFGIGGTKRGCCGKKPESLDYLALNPEYETYRLTGTYYSLRGNLSASLMLNNKGPEPLPATPTFYSLNGARLTLAPIIVPAASYMDVDLHQLLANVADEFREGSMNIRYQGGDYQLGAQVKLTDPQNSLIWAEQFVYTSKFTSNKLESVWWLPYQNSETKVVISNTSSGTIAASVYVDGTSPHQSAPLQIALAPWETRVLEIMEDIVGHQNGHVHTSGGISIEHTGNPGAVLARMFVEKSDRGYSASIPFVDPDNTLSQKWHGNGLRLKNLDGGTLRPVLVARNTSDQSSTISGKIPYTLPNGEMAGVTVPNTTIAPNSTRELELRNLIQAANVPATIAYAGIELEYTTPKGTVVVAVQSMSQNGTHVLQVPMFDPQKMPSSAGGFPWKADGDYSTIVYIKNETSTPKKYGANLILGNGSLYSLGVKEVKGRQTIEIDFRKLRDNQIPDANGNLIPLSAVTGQIAWSLHGPENRTLSGRSEQISLQNGFASTYACHNCCPDGFGDAWIDAYQFFGSVGETESFIAMQRDVNCNGTTTAIYPASVNSIYSNNAAVADFVSGSTVEAFAPGATTIEASWQTGYYTMEGVGYYECYWVPVYPQLSAPVEVVNVVINVPPNVEDGATANFSVTVTGGTPTAYQWSFEAPGGSGNNPHVNFTAPTAASTGANAHWFARPNNPCSAGFNSQYTIKIQVSFQNRGPITKEAPYTVSVGTNWGGGVDPPATSAPAGTLELAFDSGTGLWKVVGPGSLQRVPSPIIMRTPQNSQFYNKTLRHEEVHVEQYATGIFSDLYKISNVMPRLLPMTDPNKQVLEQQIFQTVQTWRGEQDQILAQRLPHGEREAYAVSDPIAPQYKFQAACNGF